MKGKHSVSFYIGICFIGIVVLLIVTGMIHSPYNPNTMDGMCINQPPSIAHPFGTDNFGRDILSRVMVGAKTTFLIALSTVAIGAFIGILVGSVTGYYGGIVDRILMRINDGIASFPSILLALIFVTVKGTGTSSVVLALGIIFVPSFARIVRSEFLRIKSIDYVQNAKLCGAGNWRVMFVHILPNTKKILLPSIGIAFNNAVLAESGMSYLGLGVQPPDASLGRMLSEAQSYLLNAPWYSIAPGMVIIITVLGFYLISEDESR